MAARKAKLSGKKLQVWRCIIRRLANDAEWWAGWPGLKYGLAAIDDLAVACARWMERWWDGPDQLARWETNGAATRIMNAAAISLAGTCDMHCRSGHTLDCEIRRIDLAHLPAHEVLSDDACERALANIERKDS